MPATADESGGARRLLLRVILTMVVWRTMSELISYGRRARVNRSVFPHDPGAPTAPPSSRKFLRESMWSSADVEPLSAPRQLQWMLTVSATAGVVMTFAALVRPLESGSLWLAGSGLLLAIGSKLAASQRIS